MWRFAHRCRSWLIPALALATLQVFAQSPDSQLLEQLTPEQRQQLMEQYLQSRGDAGATTPDPSRGDGAPSGARRPGSDRDEQDAWLQAERRRRLQRRAEQLRNEYRRFTDIPYSDDLQPFGYALFLGASPSTFAPVDNVPVPAHYVLGPGDQLRVHIYENNSASYVLEVSRDGSVSIPRIGPVQVAGRSFSEVQTLIGRQIEQRIIGAKAEIGLGRLRSMQVFLAGDVNQPGAYTVSALSTITNALFAAGGVSPAGSLRQIQLKRDGQRVVTLDLYDLLIHGDARNDVRMQPGDVIFVPAVGPQVAVDGEVKRPAIYELDGERTVGQMVELAGGLLASSSSSAIIERVLAGKGRTVVGIGTGAGLDLRQPIQDGDAIKIKQVAPRIEDKVRVEGFVKYPGRYPWLPGMSLADLMAVASPLSSDTGAEVYAPVVLVERTSAAGGVRRWHAFARGAQGLVPPEPLQPNDLVVLLGRAEVDYLSSADVRAVVTGRRDQRPDCPGLEQLSALLSSQRASRLVQIFASERQADDLLDRWARSPALADGMQQDRPERAEASAVSGLAAAAGQNRRPGEFPAVAGGVDARALESRTGRQATAQASAGDARKDGGCPQIYRRVPQILPFLLERAVAVFGEVRRPGLYPVADGTPFDVVLNAAGGLTAEGDPRNVEYVSYTRALETGSSSYETLKTDDPRTLAMGVAPGDIFNFRPVYVGQETGVVRLGGELRFPGTYSIIRGERLSDLLRRAGGLTEQAYPYGAVFTRESARRAEQQTNRRAARDLREALVTAVTSGALPSDSDSATQFLSGIVQSLETTPAVGRVVIETDPDVLMARPELDVVVEPGDRLYIPKRPATVTVTGQVLNSGSVAFVPGRDAAEYIRMAGGYTQGADPDRSFLILPNGVARRIDGSFWNFSKTDVPPGSYIVVPRDATPLNPLVMTERVLGIVSNLAVSAAALAVIDRN